MSLNLEASKAVTLAQVSHCGMHTTSQHFWSDVPEAGGAGAHASEVRPMRSRRFRGNVQQAEGPTLGSACVGGPQRDIDARWPGAVCESTISVVGNSSKTELSLGFTSTSDLPPQTSSVSLAYSLKAASSPELTLTSHNRSTIKPSFVTPTRSLSWTETITMPPGTLTIFTARMKTSTEGNSSLSCTTYLPSSKPNLQQSVSQLDITDLTLEPISPPDPSTMPHPSWRCTRQTPNRRDCAPSFQTPETPASTAPASSTTSTLVVTVTESAIKTISPSPATDSTPSPTTSLVTPDILGIFFPSPVKPRPHSTPSSGEPAASTLKILDPPIIDPPTPSFLSMGNHQSGSASSTTLAEGATAQPAIPSTDGSLTSDSTTTVSATLTSTSTSTSVEVVTASALSLSSQAQSTVMAQKDSAATPSLPTTFETVELSPSESSARIASAGSLMGLTHSSSSEIAPFPFSAQTSAGIEFVPTLPPTPELTTLPTPTFTALSSDSLVAASSTPSTSTGAAAAGVSTQVKSGDSWDAAKVVAPTVSICIVIAAVVLWWLIRREKRKRKGREMEERAEWFRPEYVEGMRAQMMGLDASKVGKVDGCGKKRTRTRERWFGARIGRKGAESGAQWRGGENAECGDGTERRLSRLSVIERELVGRDSGGSGKGAGERVSAVSSLTSDFSGTGTGSGGGSEDSRAPLRAGAGVNVHVRETDRDSGFGWKVFHGRREIKSYQTTAGTVEAARRKAEQRGGVWERVKGLVVRVGW